MTTTLAPAETGLLRAVCLSPADDTPRLILADWWEEHGQEERAELVRVQIELADARPWPPMPVQRREFLRWRERELLGASRGLWCAGPGGTAAVHVVDGAVPKYSDLCVYIYRRGFVAEVRCTLADWYGKRCEICGTLAEAEQLLRQPVEQDDPDCKLCRGTGRVNAHGLAIVAAAPIERVTLTDRKPNPSAIGPMWLVGYRGSHPDSIPAEFKDHFPETCQWLDRVEASYDRCYFATEQNAFDALSCALLAWARRLAFPDGVSS